MWRCGLSTGSAEGGMRCERRAQATAAVPARRGEQAWRRPVRRPSPVAAARGLLRGFVLLALLLCVSAGKDYYRILGVPRSANAQQIKKAYRKLSMKWHPDKNQDKKEQAQKKFIAISEAYEVLSDKKKKKTYDQYGEEGLKGGAPPPGGEDGAAFGGMGGMPGGFAYQFNGDPHDIFSRFFKGSAERSRSFGNSPFDDMGGFFGMGGMGGMPGMMGGKGMGKGPDSRPVVFDLNCSLEDLYNGKTKKMKINRKSTTLTRDSEALLEVDVKPGWKAGTKVTFNGEGDEIGSTGKAQDVVFIIREKQHATFTREGSNLLHHTRIPLVDALTGFKLDVPTLDNRVLRVSVRDMVTPNYAKVVRGEGMPSSKSPGFKGDLIITFDVKYPDSIGEDAKEELKRILPRS
mmetsp:Transcript_4494/g.7987  ORF Transcript_4494/g.7987 Transcript_4494/m.7987 type:complete len:404 (+) Transcript_4494:53-1264(+)